MDKLRKTEMMTQMERLSEVSLELEYNKILVIEGISRKRMLLKEIETLN